MFVGIAIESALISVQPRLASDVIHYDPVDGLFVGKRDMERARPTEAGAFRCV